MADSYAAHRKRVEEIASKVEAARERGETPTISHGSNHSVRPDTYNKDERIHIERLDHFLEVDPEEHRVVMEPDISMRELVNETLKYGLIPYVVPEFPEITVGGAIQGGAGESSCFKYGGFGNHCDLGQAVTGDGAIVEATPEKNSDLFYGNACSYGSLGILTEVEMNLRHAMEYVKLQYIRVDGFEDAIETMKAYCDENVEFIDGIMFSRDRGVVMVGTFNDDDDLPVSRFTRARDEWFYIHADRISQEKERYEENIPLRDYLFRYDIGAFWTIRYGFEELGIPFNRATRTLLHPFMNTAVGYDSGIHGGNFFSEYIIQDIITANEDTLELLEWIDRNLDIYPLWLLPIQPQDKAKLAPNYLDTDLAINIGIWGRPDCEWDIMTAKKRLEEKAMEIESRKTLYAQQFYTEEEFWSIYDRDWYEGLREKYNAEGVFPSVYEVTHVDELPEPDFVGAFTGMWKSVLSR